MNENNDLLVRTAIRGSFTIVIILLYIWMCIGK